MEFIDNTGHIFSLPSYDKKPIGYEYEESQYVFWIEDNTNYLSVNNWYSKVINIAICVDDYAISEDNIDLFDFSISIDSKIYKLISPIEIHNLVANENSINDYVALGTTSSDKFKSTLNNDDLFCINVEDTNKFLIIPIYVIGCASENGTWISNILVHVKHYSDSSKTTIDFEDWCPISVGGIYNNEYEELEINGKNLGVELPKDILKSVYQASFFNNEFNEVLYNEKLKEYLLNFIKIKGQMGNFDSAISSLKWFGYNEKITISKLLENDNNVKTQFIRDYFDINTDILHSYNTFRNSTYISLSLPLTNDTGVQEEQKFNYIDSSNEFTGEGKPILEDLTEKTISVEVGSDIEKLNFIKPYFDWSFYELGLKLACLKMFYQKYFLPIHLKVFNASTEYKVYANDIKMTSTAAYSLTEHPVCIEDRSFTVNFPIKESSIWLNRQVHYVDDNFNEFKSFTDNDQIYYIDDTCACIPIEFTTQYDMGTLSHSLCYDKFLDCTLLLEKEINGKSCRYIGYISKKTNIDDYFCIISTNKEIVNLELSSFSYSIDNISYSPYIKGISKFKEYIKSIYTDTYKLHYNDDLPYITYDGTDIQILDTPQTISNGSNKLFIPKLSTAKANVIYGLEDVSIDIVCVPNFYIKFTYDENSIYDIFLYDKTKLDNIISAKNSSDISGLANATIYEAQKEIFINNREKITINSVDEDSLYSYFEFLMVEDSELIYETNFKICQKEGIANTQYNNFVIYPKMLNKANEEKYWVNSNFRLKLLVNNVWYKYEFTLKIPDTDIKFGKLEYKYWDNANNFLTNFNQIKWLDDNQVIFNAYMHEPKLVTVNNINWFDDMHDYLTSTNQKYFNGSLIQSSDFTSYIEYNDKKIRIVNDIIYNKIGFNIIEDLFGYDDITVLISKKRYCYLVKIYDANNEFYNYMFFEGEHITEDYDNYRKFKLSEDGSSYIENGVAYEIKEEINYTSNIEKYNEKVHLPVNTKYLNNIHIYNIKEKTEVETNILEFRNKISTIVNGILFEHSGSYYSDINTFDNKFYITGKTVSNTYNDVVENKEYKYLMDAFSKYSNTSNIDLFSFYWNEYIKSEKVERWYCYVNKDGEYYDKPSKDIYTYVALGSSVVQYNTFKNIYKLTIDEFKNSLGLGSDINIYKDGTKFIYEKDNVKYDCIYKVKYYNTKELDFTDITNEQFISLYNGIHVKDIVIQCEWFYSWHYVDEYIPYIVSESIKIFYDGTGNYFMDGQQKVYVQKTYQTISKVARFATNKDSTIKYVKYVDGQSAGLVAPLVYKYKIGSTKNYPMCDNFGNVLYDTDGNILYGEPIFDTNGNIMHKIEIATRNSYDSDGNIIKEEIWDTIDNPSMYWYDLSVNDYSEIVADSTESISQINEDYNTLDMWHDISLIDSALYTSETYDDSQEYKVTSYEYDNCLKYDMTGFKGKYVLHYTLSSNMTSNDARIIVYISYKDGTYKVFYDDGDAFTLDGTETNVFVVFQISNSKNFTLDKNAYWINPWISKITEVMANKTYDIDKLDDNYIEFDFESNHYKYGDNVSKNVVALYNEFFSKVDISQYVYGDSNLEYKGDTFYLYKPTINLSTYLDYDFYLMHDMEYWYAVFISKQTINDAIKDSYLEPDNILDLLPNTSNNYYTNTTKYELEHIKSGNSFLINRMKYVNSEGVNQFDNTDIIVAYVANNFRLPVNMNMGTKWKISGKSIGMKTEISESSNSEMVIVDIPNNDTIHESGYYDVTVRYCIDRFVDHQYVKTATFKVK